MGKTFDSRDNKTSSVISQYNKKFDNFPERDTLSKTNRDDGRSSYFGPKSTNVSSRKIGLSNKGAS